MTNQWKNTILLFVASLILAGIILFSNQSVLAQQGNTATTSTTPTTSNPGAISGVGQQVGGANSVQLTSADREQLHDRLMKPPVTTLWRLILGLADALVIVFFVVIAFATILHVQYDTYGVKKALPPLILGIVLAHFSLLIVQYIVDFAQVLSAGLFNLAAAPTGGPAGLVDNLTATIIKGGANTVTNAVTNTATALGAGGLAAGAAFLFGFGTVTIYAAIFGLILLFIPLLFIFILGVLLYVRTYAIILLAILAPLAWLSIAWPPTKGIFKTWWTQFIRWVFMGPAVVLFLYFAIEFHKASSGSDPSLGTYILTLFLLYQAITLPIKWGGSAVSTIANMGKKYGNQAVGKGNEKFGRKMEEWGQKDFGKKWGINSIGATLRNRKAYEDEEYDTLKKRVDTATIARFRAGPFASTAVGRRLYGLDNVENRFRRIETMPTGTTAERDAKAAALRNYNASLNSNAAKRYAKALRKQAKEESLNDYIEKSKSYNGASSTQLDMEENLSAGDAVAINLQRARDETIGYSHMQRTLDQIAKNTKKFKWDGTGLDTPEDRIDAIRRGDSRVPALVQNVLTAYTNELWSKNPHLIPNNEYRQIALERAVSTSSFWQNKKEMARNLVAHTENIDELRAILTRTAGGGVDQNRADELYYQYHDILTNLTALGANNLANRGGVPEMLQIAQNLQNNAATAGAAAVHVNVITRPATATNPARREIASDDTALNRLVAAP